MNNDKLRELRDMMPRLPRAASCATIWLPKLIELGMPIPKTEIVVFDEKDVAETEVALPFMVEQVRAMAEKIGFPCFIRTGQTSAKHYWKDTCFIQSAEDIKPHMDEIIMFSLCADLMGLPINVWLVREIIPMRFFFKSFNGDMPINRERRFFVRNNKIQCSHPYWPALAFKEQENLPVDWQALLETTNKITDEDERFLITNTGIVASAFNEYWSVDWCQKEDGNWVLIDMARGEESFHWPECKYGKEPR